jgi:hypothetical protein
MEVDMVESLGEPMVPSLDEVGGSGSIKIVDPAGVSLKLVEGGNVEVKKKMSTFKRRAHEQRESNQSYVVPQISSKKRATEETNDDGEPQKKVKFQSVLGVDELENLHCIKVGLHGQPG